MTDLLQVLPDFDTAPFSHLLPKLERALVTAADLLTLDAGDIAKRTQLPPGELRKLTSVLIPALHRQLGFGGEGGAGGSFLCRASASASASANTSTSTSTNTSTNTSAIVNTPDNSTRPWRCISTLDEKLDAALGGGIPSGYLVEVTGESGAGKTQLLLTLLLAAQLPSPRGLDKSTIYISTEAPLATTRLTQLLSSHPLLTSLPPHQKPSLSRILSIQTPDLESQDHILRYQLPVAIQKHNVGLVILDSVAANYRAEFEKKGSKGGPASLAKRGTQLAQLGALMRELARTQGVAIVVANQVADRFTHPPSSSNPVSRTTWTNSPSTAQNSQLDTNNYHLFLSPDPLSLDHQQRWFTGWGDMQSEPPHVLKTPSLGLVWTNQLACRIALTKQPILATRSHMKTSTHSHQTGNGNGNANHDGDDADENQVYISKWRRRFKVVFSPWAPPSPGKGIEFEIVGNGIQCVEKDKTDV